MDKFVNELIKDMAKCTDKGIYSSGKFFLIEGTSEYYNIGVTDGHVAKWYNKKDILVDINHEYFYKAPLRSDVFENEGGEVYHITTERVMLDKKLLVKLANNNDGFMWIDSKFLDYFTDKYTDMNHYELISNGEKTPIKLYRNDTLVGLIMPVIYKR